MTTNSTTEKEVQFVQEWIETNKDNKLDQPLQRVKYTYNDQPDYQRIVKWLWFLVGVAVFCNIFQFIIILSLIK